MSRLSFMVAPHLPSIRKCTFTDGRSSPQPEHFAAPRALAQLYAPFRDKDDPISRLANHVVNFFLSESFFSFHDEFRRTPMRQSLAIPAVLMASAALIATPASAATFIAEGDSASIFFDGSGGDPVEEIDGLSAQLELLLTGINADTFTFDYTLTKTSDVGGEDARVSGFAFDTDPEAVSGTASGTFGAILFNGKYPNQIGDVGACLTNSNSCSGGGGGGAGAFFGAPATGTFTLTFADSPDEVTLSNFHVRYQGLTGLNGIGSATGSEVTNPVPEPGTWAMMLLGFGAVGFAMRRRRSKEPSVRFAF